MAKHIVVLVGNIGSGKSTLAKKYVEKGYICVSRDGLRYMLGAGNYRFDQELEPRIFSMERMLVEYLMEYGLDIVVDEIGISRSLRSEYLFLAQMHGYEATAHVLPKLSKNEAVDRRMLHPHGRPNREEWEGVWDKFDRIASVPTLEEGFKEVIVD